jgi:YkoY family integral membrane protein
MFDAFSPLLALSLPSGADLAEAIPVIFALIIIEGLLSVDNALAIAAMANHLPEKQKYKALKYGIIGAYFFRGLCLAFAAWIIENPWLKIGGAAYLVYLMCEHFTGAGDENNNGKADAPNQRGFFATIVAIEFMDLSLSVDNVVAAVAMSPKLWVVCTGVFIGILALRFVAGACIRLLEKFPILADTAFILIGYVGGILVYELLSNPASGIQIFPGPVHVSALQKFAGILLILAISIAYAKQPAVRTALRPLLKLCLTPMRLIAVIVGLALKIILLPFQLLINIGKRLLKKPAASHNPQIS